jgi:hypothetical protein
MRPSVTNLKSICRGGCASIALLAALLALSGGAQALAPAPAAAMIDLGGECGGPVVLDPSYCDENGGGGQTGTGGDSAGGDTENWQKPEVIVVDDPVGPCRRSPASCLPSEIRAGRQARADGPRIPFRSRHGARPARVAEVPLTRDECVKLTRGLPVLGSDVVANRVNEEVDRIAAKLSIAMSDLSRLRTARASLSIELRQLRAEQNPSRGDKSRILEIEEALERLQDHIEPLEQQLAFLYDSRRAKEQLSIRLTEANGAAHKVMRDVCRRRLLR